MVNVWIIGLRKRQFDVTIAMPCNVFSSSITDAGWHGTLKENQHYRHMSVRSQHEHSQSSKNLATHRNEDTTYPNSTSLARPLGISASTCLTGMVW